VGWPPLPAVATKPPVPPAVDCGEEVELLQPAAKPKTPVATHEMA